MRLARTARFKRAYQSLSKEQQSLVRRALSRLQENPQHPGLRVKRIKGTRNIWEARASRSLRITFQMEGDVLILRNVGEHDTALDRP